MVRYGVDEVDDTDEEGERVMGVRFVNVRELKNKTSAVLLSAQGGQHVIVTFRGKPYALIRKFAEEELEDFILANHPEFQEAVRKSRQENLRGETVDLRTYIRQRDRKSRKVHRTSQQARAARA